MDENTRAVLMVVISSGTTVGVALLKMRPSRGKSSGDDEVEPDEPSPLDDLEVDPVSGKIVDTNPHN